MEISHHSVVAKSALSIQVTFVEGEGSLDNHGSLFLTTLITIWIVISSSKKTLSGPAIIAASRCSIYQEK